MISRAKLVDYIAIHTSAGFTDAKGVQAYFLRSKEKGGRGWNTGGYHIIIEEDGTIVRLYDFEVITNGVRGFNSKCIHISYVGGLKRENGKVIKDARGNYVSEDTRTNKQKAAIHYVIQEAISWLKANGKDITKNLMVLGHRDFFKDKNNNNVIDPNERLKDCPCFDVIPEYNILYGATNSIQMLPSNR